MTRAEAYKIHQCKACVLYDSKRKECKQLDLPLPGNKIDHCPVPDSLHKEWKKLVEERRIR